MIEMVTYRMGDHTTADDAKRYRPAEEVEAWRQKDPIIRLKKYMLAKGSLTEQEEQALQARVKKQVEDAVKEAENTAPADWDEIFNYLYDELPPRLEEQLESLENEIGKGHPGKPPSAVHHIKMKF